MRQGSLLRRTSFRLALGFSVMVIAAFLIAGGIAYALIKQDLRLRQDLRITGIFAAVAQNSSSGDQAEAIEVITAHVAAAPDQSTIFLLRDADGVVLAGNIPAFASTPGWSDVPGAVIGIDAVLLYRVFDGAIGADRLIIGLDNVDLDEVREAILGAFGWSSLAALIVALGGGAWIAARVQNRLGSVEATLNQVAEGDLAARIPLTGAGDDLEQLAGAINAALARLAALVEGMRQVSTDIAHDLRTPLNRLRILIETASEKADQGQPVAADLAAALRESDTLSATFAALLRIAQIESGARREAFRSLDLGELVATVAEVYRDVAEDAGMVLTLHQGSIAPIQGDRDLLTQLFANLIENAIRHCPAGTTITCRVRTDANQIVATVQDNGPGIPATERDKVLQRLYRVEKSRTSAGSGLGLALVKAISDLHGCELSLADAAPGLIVRLAFPIIGPTR